MPAREIVYTKMYASVCLAFIEIIHQMFASINIINERFICKLSGINRSYKCCTLRGEVSAFHPVPSEENI